MQLDGCVVSAGASTDSGDGVTESAIGADINTCVDSRISITAIADTHTSLSVVLCVGASVAVGRQHAEP